jgi:hypothetical protein
LERSLSDGSITAVNIGKQGCSFDFRNPELSLQSPRPSKEGAQKVPIGVGELRTGRSVERTAYYLMKVEFDGCWDMVNPPTEYHLEVGGTTSAARETVV